MTTERAELEAEGHYQTLLRIKMVEDDGSGNLQIKFLDDQAGSLLERRGQLAAAGRASFAKRLLAKVQQDPAPVEPVLLREEKKRKEKTDDGFAGFWAIWPRKENKPTAQRAWAKLTETDKQEAVTKAPGWLHGRDPKFIPHPGTYLNGRRWEDQQNQTKTDEPADTGIHYY
jgi:hypothetical protein